MSTNATDNNSTTKTKKPSDSHSFSDSAFKQQRLPAWQPILTAGTVLPTFFIIGIAFVPVGIGLLYVSEEVQEHIIDYTTCKSNSSGEKCADVIARNSSAVCFCEIPFTLDEDYVKNVYMYYGLTNFYQNHRRYVKSRDDNQLLGRLTDEVSRDCEPFATADVNGTKMPIAPCGAIANSLFSDELTLVSKSLNSDVPLLRTGIAWPSDKKIKFRNPPGNLTDAFLNKFAKPKNWKKPVYELDPKNEDNNGFLNEDLIVWMRTAALPTFRKLYRRINHDVPGYNDGLSKGNYTLVVKYSYSVSAFDGTKKMILSTTSILGGKNPFLGIAYIVVGSVCIIFGVSLLIIHVKCSKSVKEQLDIDQNTTF